MHARQGHQLRFPTSLNSFERMVVHEVAESLGWHQETVNVPQCKGKGKGKQKGKFKGKGKGKMDRQVTVTRVQSRGSQRPDVRVEIERLLEQLMADDSLREHPFEWSFQGDVEGERKRRAIREADCARHRSMLVAATFAA